MSEKSFLLFLTLYSSVRHHEKNMRTIRTVLPNTTELLLPMQSGAVIGHTAKRLCRHPAAQTLHLRAQNHHSPCKFVPPLPAPFPSNIRDLLPTYP